MIKSIISRGNKCYDIYISNLKIKTNYPGIDKSYLEEYTGYTIFEKMIYIPFGIMCSLFVSLFAGLYMILAAITMPIWCIPYLVYKYISRQNNEDDT